MKKLLPALLIVAATVGGLRLYGCYSEAIGARDAKIEARGRAIDSLKARAARLDTVYVRVRDTLRIVRRQTDSVIRRDTLRLTNTLIHRDTVIKLVERERIACDALIATCEERVAVQKARGDSLYLQVKAEHGRDRILGIKLPSRTASMAIGAILCKLFCPK